MRIPSTPARTLTGLDVRVPDDFTGRRNAVLVVFERSHLVAVPAWQSVLRTTLREANGAGFYVLVLIDPAPAWRRAITQWALRLEVTDDDMREDTAILWQDRPRWLAKAAVPTDSEPLLAIASPDGTVHALAPGLPRPGLTMRIADALLAG